VEKKSTKNHDFYGLVEIFCLCFFSKKWGERGMKSGKREGFRHFQQNFQHEKAETVWDFLTLFF
jgi:hypothetical protein